MRVWDSTPIADIEAGDLVWSRDDETGQEAWKPVVQVFATPNQPVIDLDLLEADGDSQELLVTAEHPLQTEQGWVSVGELEVGTLIWGRDGWAEVLSVQVTARTETVYNVEVADFHTYFVGEGGIWAHNTCWEELAEHVAHRFPGKSTSQVAQYVETMASSSRQFTAGNGATIWRRGSEILISRSGTTGTYFVKSNKKAAKEYVSKFLRDNVE